MDHIDRKIIDILQTNARAPLKEIADKVFLSSPAVSARIARLESSGVLTGYQAQIDAPKLGFMVKAFINLDMDPSRKPEFYPYIESCPHVGSAAVSPGITVCSLRFCSAPRRNWTSSSTICSSLAVPAPKSCFPPLWSIGAYRWKPNSGSPARLGGIFFPKGLTTVYTVYILYLSNMYSS